MRSFHLLPCVVATAFALAACNSTRVASTSGPVSTSAATVAAAAAPSAAPACAADAALTPAETEGPYFKAGSPERANLVEAGMSGTKLTVSGIVRAGGCTPVAHALIDVWQADATGAYDNVGYRLRGHVFTDAEGRYSFQTVVPGEYPGRTPHVHVKVQAPNGPVLTTQLYLPGIASNTRDGIFQPQMLLQDVQTSPSGMTARYDFTIGKS